MITCVLIDDEPLALEVMRLHCEKTPFIRLEGAFLSVIEAITFINSTTIDVIFLDINMPDINGLDIKPLIPASVQIIFATAYESHALESYNLEATDYLLKPVSYERFYQAATRCHEKKKSQKNQRTAITKDSRQTILVKGDKKIQQIHIKEIDYIESLKDYAKIYYKGNEKIVIRESLKKILEHLEDHDFLRVHRSYIVPINKISSIHSSSLIIGKYRVPVNRFQRRKIVEKFKERGILGDRSGI